MGNKTKLKKPAGNRKGGRSAGGRRLDMLQQQANAAGQFQQQAIALERLYRGEVRRAEALEQQLGMTRSLVTQIIFGLESQSVFLKNSDQEKMEAAGVIGFQPEELKTGIRFTLGYAAIEEPESDEA